MSKYNFESGDRVAWYSGSFIDRVPRIQMIKSVSRTGVVTLADIPSVTYTGAGEARGNARSYIRPLTREIRDAIEADRLRYEIKRLVDAHYDRMEGLEKFPLVTLRQVASLFGIEGAAPAEVVLVMTKEEARAYHDCAEIGYEGIDGGEPHTTLAKSAVEKMYAALKIEE